MIKTKDISIRDYFQTDDTAEYDIFISSIKPSNTFAGNKFKALSFDEFEYFKKVFFNEDKTLIGFIDLYKIGFDLKGSIKQSPEDEFFNASVFELFACKKYIEDYLMLRIGRTNNVLSGAPDEKMLRVNGYERLQPFNHLLTKMQFAERFNTTPDEIGKWKYDKVFLYLAADSVQNNVQREKSQLK